MKRQSTHRRNHGRNQRSSSFFEPLENRQMMAAGDLDLTFGSAGKVLSASFGFAPSAIAVQADGKMVAVGSLNNDFAVARVNASGSIDTSFGNKGLVKTDFGGNRGDTATAVMIQTDGKIVVAGRRHNYSTIAWGDHGDFAVARYLSNGALDKTFDGDGKRTIDFAGWGPSGATSLAQQPDGKILVAGFADTSRITSWNYNFAVARMNLSGALDKSFAGDGMTTVDVGAWDQATMITASPTGKIFVGGTTGSSLSNSNPKIAMTRLTAGGSLDTSFNASAKYLPGGIPGVWKYNLPGDATPRAIEAGGDGSVLMAATLNGDFLLDRLNSSGHPDKSFGGGTGRVITDFGGNDRANTVRITREGQILVAGTSSQRFALARYAYDGTPDSSFGQGGKVITSFDKGAGILDTRFMPDGKILAIGSGSGQNLVAARYVSATPTINLYNWKESASETSSAPKPGAILLTRDRVYSFPTRVYLNVGGNATFGQDYTTTMTMPGMVIKGGVARQLGGAIVGKTAQAYIDIPAGASFVNIPINVVNDTALEPVETAAFSLANHGSYTLGANRNAAVSITDDDTVRINFQKPSNKAAGGGYVADFGVRYGFRADGSTYGWDADNTAHARIQNSPGSPDFRYDSYNHMQKDGTNRKWEIAVPNGLYQVRLVAGDPKHFDSIYKMNLEGAEALSGTPSGDVRWFRRTMNVQVNDGRLTLSNAVGAKNNKIAFIDIQAAPLGANAGAVTANLPVKLVTASTMSQWTQKPSGLFADKQIDEPLWA